MYCDNQAARHIVSNLVFHKQTKYIEVNCHFIREKMKGVEIKTSFVRSKDQLVNIFTKRLEPTPFEVNISKLELMDIYNPNRGKY
jgi:hypothetical protein